MPTVAVIGAGISGLATARTLADHGFDVTVFDKGRGPGGRMATRRTDSGLRFDHGAQYFTARDPGFRRYVTAWQDAGIIEPWDGRIVEFDHGKTAECTPSERFVGVPGMNAVCKHLTRDVEVRRQVRIDSMLRDGRWRLFSEDESVGACDRVVVAVPPAQAIELLKNSPSLVDQISKVRMAPCWAVMLAFNKPIPFEADGAFVSNSAICWMARDSSKPGRDSDADCWVVHASAEWSLENLELPTDTIAEMLLSEFFAALGIEAKKPSHLVAHRWRYANPVEPLPAGCLMDQEQQVVVCGDWCLGKGIESAFLSGMEAAGVVMQDVFRQVG